MASRISFGILQEAGSEAEDGSMLVEERSKRTKEGC